MQDNRKPRYSVRRGMLALACALLASCALVSATPTAALALETAKCSAKPNGGGSSDVLGGQETRITWEGQASADESVASVSLTLPEGTSYSTDDARLTLLSGDDLMTRERPKTTVSSDGQTVTFALDEAAPAGS